jgi:hypothetical protein
MQKMCRKASFPFNFSSTGTSEFPLLSFIGIIKNLHKYAAVQKVFRTLYTFLLCCLFSMLYTAVGGKIKSDVKILLYNFQRSKMSWLWRWFG